jgi:hypothetical protein
MIRILIPWPALLGIILTIFVSFVPLLIFVPEMSVQRNLNHQLAE